ncbi:MAG: tetratricopeptide repeat protein, partial [Candidatus Binataceae bacterium]
IKSKTVLVEIEAHGFPEESERLVEEARLLWDRGGRRTARGLLADALALDPLSSHAVQTLGSLMIELGECQEGLREFKKAREFGGENPDLLGKLANTCLKLGHKAGAIAYLKAALQLDPGDFNTLRQLRKLGYRRQTLAGERRSAEAAPSHASRGKPSS